MRRGRFGLATTDTSGPPDGGLEGIEGVPRDEPIWLKSIFPRMVWERVVAAVAAQQATRDADSVVDVTDWVISDRRPSELERTRPTEPATGWSPPDWIW